MLATLSVALIEARAFVETPSLTKDQQRDPDTEVVTYVNNLLGDILIGSGVTFLGLGAMVVFVVTFAGWLADRSVSNVATTTMLVGAAIAAAGVMVGFGVDVTLAAASEESSPATVAAVYIVADSLGYIGWTAFGLVTGGVFVAGRSAAELPRWIVWFSLAITVVFVGCAFAPFLSWVPALLWLLVIGPGLLLAPAIRNE